ATASLLLENGVPPTGKPFPVGTGVEIVLVALEDALARVSPKTPGGRENRDLHDEPGRVVVAPASARSGGSPSLEVLVPALRKGVLFRSHDATERMTLLARERWGELVRLFHENKGKPGWAFLVKLAYETDKKGGREHLWFNVTALEDDRVEAQ